MLQKTHFHPRGFAKMENMHFRSGFIGTTIRALAQRGAQNSCPLPISKLFLDVFFFLVSWWWNWTHIVPKWPGQNIFAYKVWGICHGTNKFTYKTRITCLLAFDSRMWFSLLRLFYSKTCAPVMEFCFETQTLWCNNFNYFLHGICLLWTNIGFATHPVVFNFAFLSAIIS